MVFKSPHCIFTCQLIILELPYDGTRVIFLVVNEGQWNVKGSCFNVQLDCNVLQLVSANMIEVEGMSQKGEARKEQILQRKRALPSGS
jgi:hypothetical protein